MTHTQDLRRVAATVHGAAEHVAEVHEDLGPEAAAVAAALTLLNSPTILGLLRRIAVSSVATLLTIGDVVLEHDERLGTVGVAATMSRGRSRVATAAQSGPVS